MMHSGEANIKVLLQPELLAVAASLAGPWKICCLQEKLPI